MRITSGLYKNKPVASPASSKTHPMGDRERLALFNMLTCVIPGATVLDSYAGTGALGLEALSRGAKSVIFVDNFPVAIKTIQKNLASLPLSDPVSAIVIKSSVESFVSSLTTKDVPSEPKLKNSLAGVPGSFNLIFADPPYETFKTEQISPLVNLLSKDGVLVVSAPKTAKIDDLKGVKLLKTHTYAAASISLFQKI